ncbi:MAG: hypothetical protein KGZ97_07275 [Bacteroidetes bacterium]|nr:hypothetical protein [Bacteroidota bacterium]
MSFKKYLAVVVLLVMIIFSSCIRDIQTARKYVIDKPFKPVIILPPANIIKSTYPYNPDTATEKPEKLDITKSLFLNSIDDEAVINSFINSLQARLTRYGYSVYGPGDMAEFISKGQKVFVFSVAQLELMEYPDTLRPNYVYNNVYYEQAIKINTLVQNTWFEFSELNHPDRPINVLFSMQHTSDFIDGEYKYDWARGGVVYEYTPFRLTEADVQRLNEFSGQQSAQYIYDFLMNVHVSDKISKPFNVNNYLMLDRERRIIRRANDDERFFIIKLQD